jgi:NAD(P)-dependent dehydrogenase (short-subunit alcohol dehydrogenase family)
MQTVEINLNGKRALVTGGNTGIGASIATRLAAAGACVVIDYVVRPEAATALVEAINQQYGEGKAIAIAADISKEEEVIRLFQEAGEKFGGLDILVNNAGTESMYGAMEMPMSEWDRVMGVNLRGPFMCARTFATMASAHGTGGVVINISSMHDVVPRMGAAHYNSSKAGLTMLTKVLALEWGEIGIRVVTVSPGAIDSHREGYHVGDSWKNYFTDWVPLKRVGEVDEVANMVIFLASDMASYITGATIYIDGAYSSNLVRYDPRKWEMFSQEKK